MSTRIRYVTNPECDIVGPRGHSLGVDAIEKALHRSRVLLGQVAELDVDVFALLGMRNLSAFVGEVFAAAMVAEHDKLFKKNPHQDGYPDLLLLDSIGRAEWVRLKDRLRDKSPFSPFPTGGFEVKATCGDVPTPKQCKKLGCEKPVLGDQRIKLMKSYNWKAHHRKTNNLFGIFWDFVDELPTIVAVFYSNTLTVRDWGKVVKPKAGGGRTTSVSIMKQSGVKKLYDGWVIVIDSEPYSTFFDRRNGCDSMQAALRRPARH